MGMSAIPREDEPGAWHHVMNRGVAKRTLFERNGDMRMFQTLLAREVRAKTIEVHAYSFMATHFHLLVRSPSGCLSRAMQRMQLGYSIYFNRTRGRDGPLVRGRFRSKRVTSDAYRMALVAYIEWNPVDAGLVTSPAHYPHGSASHYQRSDGPRWLERSWVEGCVRAVTATECYRPADYLEAFGQEVFTPLRRVVGARIGRGWSRDPLQDLVKSAPSDVLRWMRQRARLADGTRPGLPVADVVTLESLIEAAAFGVCWRLKGARTRSGWKTARAALSYDLCGLSQDVISVRMGCSIAQISNLIREHRRRINNDAEYAARVARLGQQALAIWDKVMK